VSEVVSGTAVSGGERSAHGRLVAIRDANDLLAEMDRDGEIVVYLEAPNVTMMAPIFDRVAALVCERGDAQAHVAIVARELGIPCLVQCPLADKVAELEGTEVTVDAATGQVLIPA